MQDLILGKSYSQNPQNGKLEIASAPPKGLSIAAVILTINLVSVIVATQIFLSLNVISPTISSSILCVISLLHGLIFFVVHGTNRITAAGIFMIFSALLVGYSGLIVLSADYFSSDLQDSMAINLALLYATLSQVGVGFICQFKAPISVSRSPRNLTSHGFKGKTIGFIAIAIIYLTAGILGPFANGFAFSASAMIAMFSILSESGLRSFWNVCATVGAILIYGMLFHDGTGRLRFVALLCVIGFTFFLRYGNQIAKLVIVLSIPFALQALGTWRNEIELSSSGSVAHESGLSSMFVGIRNLGYLIRDNSELEPSFGISLLSPLRPALGENTPAFIPEALGYELVEVLHPELAGTGFSTVSTIYGEFWWSFRGWGILVCALTLGMLLLFLDRAAMRAYHRHDSSAMTLAFILAVIFIGNVGDLAWSGFHTWIVRMYSRILFFTILIAIVAFFSMKNRSLEPAKVLE